LSHDWERQQRDQGSYFPQFHAFSSQYCSRLSA